MNKERLLKLADFLGTVPRKQFKMETFGDNFRECGFAGCALGWAAHKRLFDGLAWGHGGVFYEGEVDFLAAQKLFEISFHDSIELFTPAARGQRETPKQVAKRIREFVANGPTP